ncbi:MAG TPA: LysM peptidoglycan-binding domain-containing protein [Candidatus Dormibacteraeota bacterium]|jgi:LysM repeat protein|nr:LysM peptidoglycan-binding domain-containing protein [Candidatus Dormibacteraeota bacterium]
MSSYASMDRHFANTLTALNALNAQASNAADGGSSGDVSLGRYSTIIKPAPIPTSAPVNRQPITYTVKAGESLSDIAARYGVTVSEIRWSNTNLFNSDTIATGDQIIIPPVHGVVVITKSSDTVDSLAAKYGVDPQVVIDFNRLRTTDLSAGTLLVIPGGVGGAFPPPPAIYQILSGQHLSFSVKVVNCCLGPYVNNKFPVGWCTYYVATWRNVTWTGDAGWWYANAAAQGYSVGSTPKVGAIMVTWESWAGHVAYVEAVNPDGSWMVSEMNWVAFDVIDQRTIRPGQLGQRLVGFIY